MEEERRRTYKTEESRRGGAHDNKDRNESDGNNLYMQHVFIASEV